MSDEIKEYNGREYYFLEAKVNENLKDEVKNIIVQAIDSIFMFAKARLILSKNIRC